MKRAPMVMAAAFLLGLAAAPGYAGGMGGGSGSSGPSGPSGSSNEQYGRPTDATVQISPGAARISAEEAGYTNVNSMVLQGTEYVGQAMRDGKTVYVHVNATTGLVTE